MEFQSTDIGIEGEEEQELHRYDFLACGPRNLPPPSWKDMLWSPWKDFKYKRTVIACFVQAVYLMELDRQEKKSETNGLALAPKWWKPFKYKVVQHLVDPRDGSIYGAVLEWDRVTALYDLVVIRPSGAPRAVLVLRGTLLKTHTVRRDLEDDLRFLAWETLKGSVRFDGALKALRGMVDNFGAGDVCIAGHSLGARFALQVGKALAKEGLLVECHLFNPPSVSLATSLKDIGDMATFAWRRIRAAVFPTLGVPLLEQNNKTSGYKKAEVNNGSNKYWVPHLYVNNSDYICCHYTSSSVQLKIDGPPVNNAAAKLFVASKGPQKFLEAHGLQQWWSDDMELQLAVNQSKLINRQLRSLYAVPPKANLI